MKYTFLQFQKQTPEIFSRVILTGMAVLVLVKILTSTNGNDNDTYVIESTEQEISETITTYTEFHIKLREDFRVITGHKFLSRTQQMPSNQFCYLDFENQSGSILNFDHTLAEKMENKAIDWVGGDNDILHEVEIETGISFSSLKSAKDDCVFIEGNESPLKQIED